MAALTDEHGLANDLVLLDDASTDNVVDLIHKRFKNCKRMEQLKFDYNIVLKRKYILILERLSSLSIHIEV